MTTCEHFNGAIICSFDDGVDYRIKVRGKIWDIGFHRIAGPYKRLKNGDPAKTDLPNYVLDACSWWVRQGKRVGLDGMCIYEDKGEFW